MLFELIGFQAMNLIAFPGAAVLGCLCQSLGDVLRIPGGGAVQNIQRSGNGHGVNEMEEIVECCELDGSDKLGWSSGKGKKENRVLVKRDEQERSRKAPDHNKSIITD